MLDRRRFINQTAAAGIVASAFGSLAGEATKRPQVIRLPARIKSAIRREETVRRYRVHGDNWHMSWASDDRQYVSLCDGYGLAERPTGSDNSRLLTVSGAALNAEFHDIPTYPALRMPAQKLSDTRYYNFGTLALDGHLYQFLSTLNTEMSNPGARFIGAKLIHSPDNGRTWCNQDSSTPVVWEDWQQRSRRTMVFFEEDSQAFSLLSVLQMGQNYAHNRDGYIYVYAPNGNTDGTMNELVMFRAAKAKILHRGAYEYFGGLQPGGNAKWSPDISARKPVHTFPRGWVNKAVHPWAWMPSVSYNAPLGLYMMASWGMGVAPDGQWFGKPSYLGFWIAANPWGPWTQIHEETSWTPADDAGARAFAPQIAPKWIAADGKSFWLVWSDFQIKDRAAYEQSREFSEKHRQGRLTEEDWARWAALSRKYRPYYAFNVQRVDLVLA